MEVELFPEYDEQHSHFNFEVLEKKNVVFCSCYSFQIDSLTDATQLNVSAFYRNRTMKKKTT